jgi:hypothetical protein
MSQDSYSKSKRPQSANDKHSAPETTDSGKTSSHLKLVVSNPIPVQVASDDSQPTVPKVGFSVKVCSRGHDLYEVSIQDPFHEMECDLIMEIERDTNETTVACHFPVILSEQNKFLDEDETLYGIIAVQFQMNVLEQLFMFCANHNASQLTIYMDDAQAEGFGVYRDFLVYSDENPTDNEEQTEIIIPTDPKTFGKWLTFMQRTNFEFEQDLWREQRLNPAIRHYIKSRAHG